MSALIRGVKAAICELGRLLKWVESVSVFLSFIYFYTFFLTSKHLLPASSVDQLSLSLSLASPQTYAVSDSRSATVLAAGQANMVRKNIKSLSGVSCGTFRFSIKR